VCALFAVEERLGEVPYNVIQEAETREVCTRDAAPSRREALYPATQRGECDNKMQTSKMSLSRRGERDAACPGKIGDSLKEGEAPPEEKVPSDFSAVVQRPKATVSRPAYRPRRHPESLVRRCHEPV